MNKEKRSKKENRRTVNIENNSTELFPNINSMMIGIKKYQSRFEKKGVLKSPISALSRNVLLLIILSSGRLF